MRITLNKIALYQACPYRYKLLSSKKLLKDKKPTILPIEKIIAQLLIQNTKTLHRATWQKVVSLVDKEVFKDIDILDKSIYEESRKKAEKLLLKLRPWYKTVYLKKDIFGYYRFPINYEISNSVITDDIPLFYIEGSDIYICNIIDNLSYSGQKIDSDYLTLARAALLSDIIDSERIAITYYIFGPDGGFNIYSRFIKKKNILAILDSLSSYVQLIEQNRYPLSISSECRKCPVRRSCVI
jgi:hypothetical protein